MMRRNNLTFCILSIIGLWVVIILLSSAVVRLFYAIVRTFIYLVGLISVLMIVGLVVAIFSYIIYKVIRCFTNCQRSTIDKLELVHSILSLQFKAILGLIFTYFILGVVYFIYIL